MEKKEKPNLRERAMFLLNPKAGSKMYQERMIRTGSTPKMSASSSKGYGAHGASSTLNSMVGWIVNGGSAEDDIDLHGDTLRKRARDLYAGGGLGRSGPTALTTGVIGWGIQPKPKLDGDVLGLSDEECEKRERQILREFQLWAGNNFCDSERQNNFYGLQHLAFLSELMSGDCFVLFEMKDNKRTPYKLTLRVLEADRVSTPNSYGESESDTSTETGNRIVDGVEISKGGEVVRYWITNRHPLNDQDTETLEWTTIDAYGKDTGEPNILHLMTQERPEQRRGVPFVAAEIEQVKQFDRYMKSELAANVVSSMLTAFIISNDDDGKTGMEDAVNEDEKVTSDSISLELAPGAIYDLPPGKTIKEINPIRNNSAFEQFVSTLETVIGSSMGIPKEVLIQKYESNYTAARAAMLDFWRTVRVYRTKFNAAFNQAVYEAWLSEAVASGRIEAPGFFDDPIIRTAWCGCSWIGASMGHVDPLKEVNAAEKRISLNISTQEQEASEYNGNDWTSNIRQRKKEMAVEQELLGDLQQNETNDTNLEEEVENENA